MTELRVSFGGFSSAGIKDENQDAFAACQPSLAQARYKGIALCVADGVSCSRHAQQASSTSVTHFLQDYYSTPDSWDVKTAAARVLSSLNAWLFHHGRQDSARHDSLVTTFSGLILKSATAHVLHVGDSRVYRLREQTLEQLSRDHSVQQGGREFLSRALGMDSHLEVDYGQEPLHSGDIFLLTTDGVHGFLTTAQLQQALQLLPAEAGQHQLERACRQLVQQALEQGSDDNASCCIVQIQQVAEPDFHEAQRELQARIIPPVLKAGDTIDHFRVLDVLYAGTRSHLYKVRNLRDRRDYVLKAPSLNFQDDLVYLEGFMREQWAGSRMDHLNLMKIYPPAGPSRFLYHISEWLDGITLRQWMYDNPQPDIASVRAIAGDIIHALRALQRAGMVHRDLKPENIMLPAQGGLKLIDFGTVQVRGLAEIRAAVQEDCPQGSVNYVAPETVLHGDAGYYSDLFSLGVILYEMLSGTQPFRMDQVHRRGARSLAQWQYQPLPRHDLPLWLDLTLRKACAPDPRQRYAAFSELWTDLHKPNATLVHQYQQRPLLQREPVRVWQWISAGLAVTVLLQWLWLAGIG